MMNATVAAQSATQISSGRSVSSMSAGLLITVGLVSAEIMAYVLIVRHFPILRGAPEALVGRTVQGVRRRGKYLLLDLDEGVLGVVDEDDLLGAVPTVANVTTFEGFREAARALECPGQNLVYADVDGTIGYQCTGRFPIRRTGEGSAPVPG